MTDEGAQKRSKEESIGEIAADVTDQGRARNLGYREPQTISKKPSDHIDWRVPNWLTFGLFLAIILALKYAPGTMFLGFDVSLIMSSLTAPAVRLITEAYGTRIDSFVPSSPLAAKRANEQIKSLATAINGIAAGIAVAVALKQFTSDSPNYIIMVIVIGISFWIHTGARSLLGRLKDESS